MNRGALIFAKLGACALVAFVLVLNLVSIATVAKPVIKRMYYAGSTFQCNICGSSMRKFERGTWTQDELQCPFCLSRPRHRTAYIFFRERTGLFDGTPKRMLHVAPEASLALKFLAIPNIDYLSGDLNPKAAMVQMDITDIHFPDNSFDVIYCSHVLEHVPDDRKAMSELARVLKPGGWAVIAVPIPRGDRTFEERRITSPEDRARVYGQADHVRAYGPDFVDRLEEAGFDVTIDNFAKGFTDEMVRRHGLSRESIYSARKGTRVRSGR
jgi:SAM-dependent methyltransferase